MKDHLRQHQGYHDQRDRGGVLGMPGHQRFFTEVGESGVYDQLGHPNQDDKTKVDDKCFHVTRNTQEGEVFKCVYGLPT